MSPRGAQEVTFTGHSGNVTAVEFSDSYSWMYSASEDGTIKIWDVRYDFSALGSQESEEGRIHDCIVGEG